MKAKTSAQCLLLLFHCLLLLLSVPGGSGCENCFPNGTVNTAITIPPPPGAAGKTLVKRSRLDDMRAKVQSNLRKLKDRLRSRLQKREGHPKMKYQQAFKAKVPPTSSSWMRWVALDLMHSWIPDIINSITVADNLLESILLCRICILKMHNC